MLALLDVQKRITVDFILIKQNVHDIHHSVPYRDDQQVHI